MRNVFMKKQRRWKTYSLILFFQLITALAYSQVRISGAVTAPDGTALPGITVRLPNATVGDNTDAHR